MAVTDGLSPKKVFQYFEKICSIPHGSGNIDRMSDYLTDFARERNLFCIQDEWKNVVIIKEATPGYGEEPPIILQGHMDMVAVKKPEAEIDLTQDGLELAIDGDWLFAKDTSLGGDDGIAIAYALAILDSKEIAHPRLEVIFTVDEEVGMEGAINLEVSMLQGRRMLNLDSEEEGILLSGCAGGARADWSFSVHRHPMQGEVYALKVKGLAGGHSGMEIHKGRGNALYLLGRVLNELCEAFPLSVAELQGGVADNAIPREAKVQMVLAGQQEQRLKQQVEKIEALLQEELRSREPDMVLELKKLPEQEADCLLPEDMRKLVNLLLVAPHGVQAMSAEIEGLVETSLNLGVVNLERERVEFRFSVRSSLESAKKDLLQRLESLAALAGVSCQVKGDYPGWAYRKDSPFRQMAVEVYRQHYGREPVIQAVHAGLECGILVGKLPGLDCISIGPDMKDIHTTEERLSISSTERVWRYILEILKRKTAEKKD